MFRIGEFSRFSRVSVKMLRHYDELGLLVPARIDPDTGYRYYVAGQLPRLNRIVALKDLGFSLEEIGRMLAEDLPADQVRGMLKLRRAELAQQLELTAAQLAQVEGRLAQLDRAGTISPDVVLRPVGAQFVAAIRQPVTVDDESVAALFEELETYVARYRARAPLPPLILYHGAETPEQAGVLEVAVPVNKPVPTGGRIEIRDLPGHDTVACLIHAGPYESLPDAFAVILGWIERHEYAIAGPTREVYLRFGADQEAYALPEAYVTENAAEFITEIQIPVNKE